MFFFRSYWMFMSWLFFNRKLGMVEYRDRNLRQILSDRDGLTSESEMASEYVAFFHGFALT
jgi:hypothetical protein